MIILQIQTWIFFPFCVVLGRVGIIVDSLREEKRLDVWLSWLLHNAWVALYLYHFNSWKQRALVYFIGALGEGVLHVQLLVNHYTKNFYEYKKRNANVSNIKKNTFSLNCVSLIYTILYVWVFRNINLFLCLDFCRKIFAWWLNATWTYLVQFGWTGFMGVSTGTTNTIASLGCHATNSVKFPRW